MIKSIGISAVLGLALGLGVARFERDSPVSTEVDAAGVQGGVIPMFQCGPETSCPVGCSNLAFGGSFFIYNNGHDKCVFNWNPFSWCSYTGSAQCDRRDYSGANCTSPVGPPYPGPPHDHCA